MKKVSNFIVWTIQRAWTLFLSGLFTVLPILITIGLFRFSFKVIVDWLTPLKPYVPLGLQKIPYAELFLVVLSLFLLGTLMRIFILRTLVNMAEALIAKLPLIRPIYSGIKQLVHAFSIQDKLTFKKVVLVQFPRTGVYSLGFLTSELPEKLAPDTEHKYFNVFIPTTPNPTSGYFVILSEPEFSTIDLTRQEAMAMIISGGIIQPERLLEK